jgi:hypothetical protein
VRRSSPVGLVTKVWAGRPRSRGSIPGNGKSFSLLHNVETGSGTHQASYTMDTGGCFPRGKYKLTVRFHLMSRLRMMELHLHSPMFSWLDV